MTGRPILNYERLLKTAKDWEIVDKQVEIRELELKLKVATKDLKQLTGEIVDAKEEIEIVDESKKISLLKKILAEKSIHIDCAGNII